MVLLRYQIRKGVLQMRKIITEDRIYTEWFESDDAINHANEQYAELNRLLDDEYLPESLKTQQKIGTSIHQTQANLDNVEFDFADEHNLNINDQVIQNYLIEARQRLHETVEDTMDFRIAEQGGYAYAVPIYLDDNTAVELINGQHSWETFMTVAAAADGADDLILELEEWTNDREALDIMLLERIDEPTDEEDLIQFGRYLEELTHDVQSDINQFMIDIDNLKSTIDDSPDLEKIYADVLAQSFDALNEQ